MWRNDLWWISLSSNTGVRMALNDKFMLRAMSILQSFGEGKLIFEWSFKEKDERGRWDTCIHWFLHLFPVKLLLYTACEKIFTYLSCDSVRCTPGAANVNANTRSSIFLNSSFRLFAELKYCFRTGRFLNKFLEFIVVPVNEMMWICFYCILLFLLLI